MRQMPRLAVGTIQSEADSLPILWALTELLHRHGRHVQNFLSRACFAAHRSSASPNGQSVRYLDSWLMTPQVCREIFLFGAESSDIALVEGKFDVAVESPDEIGGNLEQLCDWLNLPRICVVDVSRLDKCMLPQRPANIDGVLLDQTLDRTEAVQVQTRLESLWRVPVLGALDRMPQLRERIEQIPINSPPPREICRQLAERLSRNVSLPRIMEIASCRPMDGEHSHQMRSGTRLAEVHVAVAYDDAFQCYFPGTLDMLELQGATVTQFSPLRDEGLPANTDVVYIGCGHPQWFRKPLSANGCMMTSLWKHVSEGGRVYAEGGGLAYLCQQIRMPDGTTTPMSGILPATAVLNQTPDPPRPVEITLAKGNWLGEGWSQLRGYLNSSWRLEPTDELTRYAAQPGHELDLVGVRQAVGSRIHLNFAAQPEFLQAFFSPHSPGVDVGAVR